MLPAKASAVLVCHQSCIEWREDFESGEMCDAAHIRFVPKRYMVKPFEREIRHHDKVKRFLHTTANADTSPPGLSG